MDALISRVDALQFELSGRYLADIIHSYLLFMRTANELCQLGTIRKAQCVEH